MDLTTIWTSIWPYLGAVVAVASTIDAALPQPKPGSHWLVPRKILSFMAVNIASASNGAQPPFTTWLLRIVTPALQAQGLLPVATAAEAVVKQIEAPAPAPGTEPAPVAITPEPSNA
jgi:hypothetical protein